MYDETYISHNLYTGSDSAEVNDSPHRLPRMDSKFTVRQKPDRTVLSLHVFETESMWNLNSTVLWCPSLHVYFSILWEL